MSGYPAIPEDELDFVSDATRQAHNHIWHMFEKYGNGEINGNTTDPMMLINAATTFRFVIHFKDILFIYYETPQSLVVRTKHMAFKLQESSGDV